MTHISPENLAAMLAEARKQFGVKSRKKNWITSRDRHKPIVFARYVLTGILNMRNYPREEVMKIAGFTSIGGVGYALRQFVLLSNHDRDFKQKAMAVAVAGGIFNP